MIAVTDGKVTVSLPAFDITVTDSTPANRAPTISGAPANTVAQGAAYSFTPNAADADGDRLTFSIANKPAWATFNTSNGSLTGTPTASGVTRGIVISVTDGRASASLPAFDLTVTAPPTASVTVTWVIPTVNADGTPLTDLAGFYVRYGTASGNYGTSIRVDNPAAGSYSIQGLTPGRTYYFTVAAFDSTGNIGANGAEASKAL